MLGKWAGSSQLSRGPCHSQWTDWMDHRLNNEEQRELQTRMERRQMQDFMKVCYSLDIPSCLYFNPGERIATDAYCRQTYQNLVQRCFDDCVNDFTSKSLQSREEGCVFRCVDKFLKSNERLGQRFQELNAQMMQSGSLPGQST